MYFRGNYVLVKRNELMHITDSQVQITQHGASNAKFMVLIPREWKNCELHTLL